MSYLLDTNVVSESTQARPNERVLRWMERNHEISQLAAVSLGEIWKGIHLLDDGAEIPTVNPWE
jgi:predicted nucleic acid-binding protein